MWSAAVVEAEIATDRGAGFRNAGIGSQLDLLIFDGSPEALHEDVVAPSSLVIHADLDLVGHQHLDEVGGRQLAALSVLNISVRCLQHLGRNSERVESRVIRGRGPFLVRSDKLTMPFRVRRASRKPSRVLRTEHLVDPSLSSETIPRMERCAIDSRMINPRQVAGSWNRIFRRTHESGTHHD